MSCRRASSASRSSCYWTASASASERFRGHSQVRDIFADCLYSGTDKFAFGLGLFSILCWTVAQLPQIYSNYVNKSTEALSFFFLVGRRRSSCAARSPTATWLDACLTGPLPADSCSSNGSSATAATLLDGAPSKATRSSHVLPLLRSRDCNKERRRKKRLTRPLRPPQRPQRPQLSAPFAETHCSVLSHDGRRDPVPICLLFISVQQVASDLTGSQLLRIFNVALQRRAVSLQTRRM